LQHREWNKWSFIVKVGPEDWSYVDDDIYSLAIELLFTCNSICEQLICCGFAAVWKILYLTNERTCPADVCQYGSK
jgi:hypothetical protein